MPAKTTNPETLPPEPVLARLRAASRVLVTSHVNPDGDAVGSSIGLARILRRMGKSVTIWLLDAPPRVYAPLPGVERIHVGPQPPAAFPDGFDLAVVLECPSLDRCGLEEKVALLPMLNIDHHLGNRNYGAVNWIDTASPAVGEMVFRIAASLRAEIDVDTANALYLALFTDTGGFRYGNTSARALRLAARLVEAGVDPWEMTERIYESQDEARVRLLGRALDGLVRSSCGRLGLVRVRVSDLDELGAVEEHVQGLVNSVRAIKGVEIAALVRELSPEQSRVIFRSRGNIAVTPIAVALGGKGTKNAGSAVIGGDIDAVADVVVTAAQAFLRTLETMPGGNAE